MLWLAFVSHNEVVHSPPCGVNCHTPLRMPALDARIEAENSMLFHKLQDIVRTKWMDGRPFELATLNGHSRRNELLRIMEDNKVCNWSPFLFLLLAVPPPPPSLLSVSGCSRAGDGDADPAAKGNAAAGGLAANSAATRGVPCPHHALPPRAAAVVASGPQSPTQWGCVPWRELAAPHAELTPAGKQALPVSALFPFRQ